jgi:hypothetical protein
MKDWTDQPEAAGPQSEGYLNNVRYGDPGYPSIGVIEPLMDRELMWKERAEQERRHALRVELERAASTAARDVLLGRSVAGQVLEDASSAVDAAVRTADQPAPEPAPAADAEPAGAAS